jgi:hypothetical protein
VVAGKAIASPTNRHPLNAETVTPQIPSGQLVSRGPGEAEQAE